MVSVLVDVAGGEAANEAALEHEVEDNDRAAQMRRRPTFGYLPTGR
jgi:hypothetical protein